jgi:hypothetical protein
MLAGLPLRLKTPHIRRTQRHKTNPDENSRQYFCGAKYRFWPIATDFALQPNVRFQGYSDRAPTSGTGCER